MKQDLLEKGKKLKDIGIPPRNVTLLEKAQVAYDNYLKLQGKWKKYGHS